MSAFGKRPPSSLPPHFVVPPFTVFPSATTQATAVPAFSPPAFSPQAVETKKSFKACDLCSGHVKGCSKIDAELGNMLGLNPNDPDYKNLLARAKQDLAL